MPHRRDGRWECGYRELRSIETSIESHRCALRGELNACASRRIDWPNFKVKFGTTVGQHEQYIQGRPKVGIQYIVNYCIPTFGPSCMLSEECLNWHQMFVLCRMGSVCTSTQVRTHIIASCPCEFYGFRPVPVSACSPCVNARLSGLFQYVVISPLTVSWILCHVQILRVFRFHVRSSVLSMPLSSQVWSLGLTIL